MKSIEERAMEYAPEPLNSHYAIPAFIASEEKRQAYIIGATEQKAIDIENACKACENELRKLKTLLNESVGDLPNLVSVGKSLSNIRKAMEE